MGVDPIFWQFAWSVTVAALTASAVEATLVRFLRNASTGRASASDCRVAWILAVGAGFCLGCGILGELPRWPPAEDRDRLLTILLPLALTLESAAAYYRSPRIAVGLRCLLAMLTPPILLFNTTYLADLAGPGSAEWSPPQASSILFFLATLAIGNWALLARLPSRGLGAAVTPSLVLVTLATAATIVLSGYFRGGTLAMPLAGALVGAESSRRFAKAHREPSVDIGLPLIMLFSILLLGTFFGSLPTGFAGALFFSPQLIWLGTVRPIGDLSPRWRTAALVATVAVPAAMVVILAQVRFTAALGP